MALVQAEVDVANQSLSRIGSKNFTLAVQTSVQGVQANLNFDQTRDALLRSFVWPFAKVRLRLVSDWLTDTQYTTDQYVWEEGLLYKCNTAHTSDVFATDIANWTLKSSIDDWATLTAYIVGDFVTINALLYRCIVAHTSGTFSTDLAAGNWVVTTTKPTNVFGFSYDLPADSLRLVKNVLTGKFNYFYGDRRNRNWELEGDTILTDDTAVDIVYINKVTTVTEWEPLFTEMFIVKFALTLLNPLTGIGKGALALRQLLLAELRQLNSQTRAIGRNEGSSPGRWNWITARLRSNRRTNTTLNGIERN